MSVSLDQSSALASHLRDALPSIVKKARHTEIWGLDLEQADWQVLKGILERFLRRHSTIPGLQLARAKAALEKTLEWRWSIKRWNTSTQAASMLSNLGLCHITLHDGQYVLWVNLDIMEMKAYQSVDTGFETYQGLVSHGVAVMEQLSTMLLHAATGSGQYDNSASCVVDFKTRAIPDGQTPRQGFRANLDRSIQELVNLIRHHYPGILHKAYIINPCDEYLSYPDFDEALLKNTILLNDPTDLHQYLGSQIPPRYGGMGKSLVESDLIPKLCPVKEPEENPEPEKLQPDTASTNIKISGEDKETASPTSDHCNTSTEGIEAEDSTPRLIWSETIGFPPFVLDPDDLAKAERLCPGLAFADSNMIVKFGSNIDLAEAEALHLAATKTSIAVPTLHSAYILDGVGYIVMSYEEGEEFEKYWDRVSETERNHALEQLRDYLNQMRNIKGDYIGRLSNSPCQDGIFLGGYGDYTKYSYGPYPSEASFNEGILQALRDRLPAETLDRENDLESAFFNSEHELYQTVRSLKNHEIVFTHADLHPGNMIVRVDGIVVLLDWGLAGFWPDYWESYRARHCFHWRVSWTRMLEKFIPPFYLEISLMMRVFAKVWN